MWIPCRSAQSAASSRPIAVARLVEREPELLVGVPGRDGVVRVGLDLGHDPQHHGLRPLAGVAAEAVDLVEVVDHAHDAQLRDRRELGLGLRVAVEDDLLRLEARLAGEVQLPGGGDVDDQALLAEDPQHLGAREGLGGERDRAALAVVLGHRAQEVARPGTQVVLGHDVGGRAELASELEDVAAPDREAALVHGRGLGVDGQRRGGHDARRLCAMRPPLPRPSSASSTGWPTPCGSPTPIRGPAW